MKPLPRELRDFYFPFNWNLERLWALDVPSQVWQLEKLRWHFDIPIWSSERGKMLFDLCPSSVLRSPSAYPRHDRRIDVSDISFPIDLMFSVDRHVILDGVHRLAKYEKLGVKDVLVRDIPRALIPLFATD